jgi:predicted Fe-S protein YdhL (DUF1289 family)
MFTGEKLSREVYELKAIVTGAGFMAAAAACWYVGATGIITLAYRSLVLPPWSLYIVAAALAATSLFVASTKTPKCVRCGHGWDFLSLYFPLESRSHVMDAVMKGDLASLLNLPAVEKATMKMHVDAHVCSGCGRTGTIEVTRWEDFRPHNELETRSIEGPSVRVLQELKRIHEEARGDHDQG